MKILIINIDSIIPNLALEKIKLFHRQERDEITYNIPLAANSVDKIYVSCVFSKNRHQAQQYEAYKHAVIGGSGYDIKSKLPDEIEILNPKINIGFTTRGCVRKCPFCIVPEKEGKIRVEADLYDIWDGYSREVTLLDNNILAIPEHFKLICSQASKNDIRIDFNQGLDIRLVTDEIALLLSKTKLKRMRFALDDPKLIPLVNKKIDILRKYKPKCEPIFYVLTGFNTNLDQDLERLEFLKSRNCRAYVMQHEKSYGSRDHMRMRQWANMFWTFMKYSFQEFRVIKDQENYHPDLATLNLNF